MSNQPGADMFVLAAGLGARLGTLTRDTPKPLIPVNRRPVIEYTLELIKAAGFQKLFVNLHYQGEKIKQHLGTGERWGLEIRYVEEKELLGTGGAIRNIETMLEHDMLLTMNSDTILGRDFSLPALLSAHRASILKPLATLVVRRNPNAKMYGEVGIDSQGKVVSFLGKKYSSVAVTGTYMYVGVQAISRELFHLMPVAGSKFSITQDTYVKVLGEGNSIATFCYDGYFQDIGSADRLNQASKDLVEGKR